MSVSSFFDAALADLKADAFYVEQAVISLFQAEVQAITPIVQQAVAASAADLIANAGNTAAFANTVGGIWAATATQIQATGLKVAAQTVLATVNSAITSTVAPQPAATPPAQ